MSLILVSMRLLQLVGLAASDVGDVFWFISAVGILASFVGVIICIIATIGGSWRWMGLASIVAYRLLAGLFMVIR